MGIKENQHTEFKESWREEHLKTLCAFANTHGGKLFIGKDDQGNICGVSNSKKLLENLPNSIKDILNILPEVSVNKVKGKDVIVIYVKPSKTAISYKGKYFKRSGSTTQELKNTDLQQFLIQKNNTSWEEIVEPAASMKDINLETLKQFKQLAKNRFSAASTETSVLKLLEKLHLSKGGKLTRAALLLFGKDPQRFFPSSFIKVGRFKSDETILGMDEVKGNLFDQTTNAIDLLQKKYLNSDIRIVGLFRSDQLEIPIASLREAIVNAIVHKDYLEGVSQIKVYPDLVTIWNHGELTSKLTLEKLRKKHPSFPRNELIAGVFYKAGLIEQWGYGTLRIIQECTKAGLPDPVFEQEAGGLLVSFLKDNLHEEYLKKMQLNDRQIKAILHVKEFGKITNSEYQQVTQTSKRTSTSDLQFLVEKGILLKKGVTGKGVQYELKRGNKGAKGATNRKNLHADDLDQGIRLFEEDLSAISPNDEVRWHINSEIVDKMFNMWIVEFLTETIFVAQKFNKLFVAPRHQIYTSNGMGQTSFINESPEVIANMFREECKKFKGQIYECTISVALNYGTFRKAGLKNFHSNYGLEIKLEQSKYSILVDSLTEDNKITQKVSKFENLLHKPLEEVKMTEIAKGLGNTILKDLEHYTKKKGIL